MRFIAVCILLAFPFAEIFLLVKLAHQYGWWLALYLVVMTFLGLRLIKDEKSLFSTKMMQSLQLGGNPFKSVLNSARNLFAGVLLLIPGVISDLMAVILLLIPIKTAPVNIGGTNYHQGSASRSQHQTRAANDDVIEGEYTQVKEDMEIKEETDKLK